MQGLREALEQAVGKAEEPEVKDVNESRAADAGVREDSGSDKDDSRDISERSEPDKSPTDGDADADTSLADKSEESAKTEPAGDKQDKVPATTDKPVEPQLKPHRTDRPPQSWKKDAKGEWANLPLHVRQEVHRRDMEIEKVLQETAPVRQIAKEFQDTVAPYMARINSFGVSPSQAINQLLAADYALATSGPDKSADLMAKLIVDYGIDLSKLDGALAARFKGGQAPSGAQDPNNQMVEQIRQQVLQELAPVLTFAQQQQLQQQQTQENQQNEAISLVQSMQLDPQFPHFDEVRMDMADIIELSAKRGIAITPQEAYSKAVLLNPQLSGKIAATNAHQTAQRALNASSSVTGAPAGGGSNTVQHDGSIRGALESAFSTIR